MIPQNKLSVSTTLILLSLFATIAVTYYSNLYNFWMNRFFFEQWIYHIWVIQFFISQFLHGNFFHFLTNAVFILYFWNILEQYIGTRKILIFFLFTSVFIGIWLTLFHAPSTVGISGFALAVLSYYTLHLKRIKNPEYSGGITAIILNVILGFAPWVSFLGHILWVIAGVLYFWMIEIILKNIKKK